MPGSSAKAADARCANGIHIMHWADHLNGMISRADDRRDRAIIRLLAISMKLKVGELEYLAQQMEDRFLPEAPAGLKFPTPQIDAGAIRGHRADQPGVRSADAAERQGVTVDG